MKGMDTNWLSALGAAGVTGIFTWLVARHQTRVSNEAALLGLPLPIIVEQNKRIATLQRNQDKMWDELQQARTDEQQCRAELSEVRHANKGLEQIVIGLKERIEKLENK